MCPKMIFPKLRRLSRGRCGLLVMECLLSLVPGVVRADQLVVGDTEIRDAKIIELKAGQLRFRTADGKTRSAELDAVRMIVVDRSGLFVDFNQAERFFAAGEPARAVSRYRRSLPLATDFWGDLIAARLVQAYDAADQLDEAVQMLIRVLRSERSGPAAAARLVPQRIPGNRDARAMRSLERIDAALSKGPGEAQRVFLSLLRYEILRRLADDRAVSAARVAAPVRLPEGMRTERMYGIQLEAMQTAMLADASVPPSVRGAVMAALEQAVLDAPRGSLPGLLLLKGRVLLAGAASRDEWMRATWPLLRIVIHFADDPAAADGLLLAAVAVEHIGRADKAADMLEECIHHPRVSDETRRAADAALRSLRDKTSENRNKDTASHAGADAED